MSISGAGITKTHVVTELTLDSVDVEADIVSGTSPTAAEVCVDIWVWPDLPVTRCSPVLSGNWAVDFSGVFDIQETTDLGAFEFDDDGDATQVDWSVPNPELFVHVRHLADPSLRQGIEQLVTVEGQDWPLGETVTLTIDDPSTTASPDYTDFQTVMTSEPPAETIVSFEMNRVFDIQPGHLVTLTDGTTTRTHIVRNLTVTSVDIAADTVSGAAEPGSDVVVQIWAPFPHPIRQEVADATGNWTASFATLGNAPDGQDTYDIRPGTNGQAGQFDAGGGTLVDFQVPADAVAVLRVLQFVTGLPGGIGADMDCDGDIDAVDALVILRFVAALPVNLPPGCPPIGAGV